MRALVMGLVLSGLTLSANAEADGCNHQMSIAFFEEAVLQAERCRMEMQVYREERVECGTFFGLQERGDEMIKCYADEVALAEDTGDYTAVSEYIPAYTDVMNDLYAATMKVVAASEMLPK